MSHNTDNGITCGQFLAYVCTVFWLVGMFSIIWYYEKLAPQFATNSNPILSCPKHIVKTSCKCGHGKLAKSKIKPAPEPVVETLNPANKHYLETSQHLLSGESLTSITGRYSLLLEHNGSLVVIDNKESNKRSVINDGGRWSQGLFKLSLRENSGHLLITSLYGGSVVYSPEFFPNVRNLNYYCDNYYLVMQDDRNAVIYDCQGEALWSSGTAR